MSENKSSQDGKSDEKVSAQKVTMVYESNPKHSEPWQPGKKGGICEQAVRPLAAALLAASELDGNKRFAVYDGMAYCAQEQRPGVWHGYPVGWIDVPDHIKKKWKHAQLVTKGQLKKYRESHK